MAITKTDKERLAEFDKKLEQIKAQKKAFQSKIKSKERKERTHRLIQIGATIESYTKCEIDIDALKEYLETYSYAIVNNQNKVLDRRAKEQQSEPAYEPESPINIFLNAYNDNE